MINMVKGKHFLTNTKVTVHNLVFRGWGVPLVDQNKSNLSFVEKYILDFTAKILFLTYISGLTVTIYCQFGTDTQLWLAKNAPEC